MKDTRRSVNTRYWIDPEVEEMSKEATYLFLALLTLPENNMAGVYEISDKKLGIYTKMEQKDIAFAMNELSQKNKVIRYKTWVCIKNHIKNQKLNNNMSVSVIKDLCPAPMPVKIWLLSKEDSSEVEDWFDSLVYGINQYYNDQKIRIAKNGSNGGKDKDKYNQLLCQMLDIVLSKDDLLKILTNPLPFNTDELSKYNSMVTLTKGLDNCLVNMNTEDRIGIGSMNNEIMNTPLNGPSDKKSPFETYRRESYDN